MDWEALPVEVWVCFILERLSFKDWCRIKSVSRFFLQAANLTERPTNGPGFWVLQHLVHRRLGGSSVYDHGLYFGQSGRDLLVQALEEHDLEPRREYIERCVPEGNEREPYLETLDDWEAYVRDLKCLPRDLWLSRYFDHTFYTGVPQLTCVSLKFLRGRSETVQESLTDVPLCRNHCCKADIDEPIRMPFLGAVEDADAPGNFGIQNTPMWDYLLSVGVFEGDLYSGQPGFFEGSGGGFPGGLWLFFPLSTDDHHFLLTYCRDGTSLTVAKYE